MLNPIEWWGGGIRNPLINQKNTEKSIIIIIININFNPRGMLIPKLFCLYGQQHPEFKPSFYFFAKRDFPYNDASRKIIQYRGEIRTIIQRV